MDKAGSGIVRLEPPDGVYYEGTQVMLTALPDDGWSFTQWGGDLSGSDLSKMLLMNSNYIVSAQFTEIPVAKDTLTAQTDRGTVVGFWPPVEISWEGSTARVQYKPGTTVTVTAYIRPNYRFVCWGGDITGTENPQIFVIDRNMTITLTSEESP